MPSGSRCPQQMELWSPIHGAPTGPGECQVQGQRDGCARGEEAGLAPSSPEKKVTDKRGVRSGCLQGCPGTLSSLALSLS